MLKKSLILTFALILVVGFAYAATQSSDSSKATTSSSSNSKATSGSMSSSSKMAASTKVEGTIQSVDLKTHTMTVTVGTDTKTYKFGTKTSFMSDKKHVKAAELKAGDKVTLTVDSKNYARKVDISSATAAQ
jgi:hypothetical protein